MANQPQQQTKKPMSPVDRITELEKVLPQWMMIVDQNMTQFRQQLSGVVEVLDAMTRLWTQEAVAGAMQENRAERMQQQTDARKADVIRQLETGELMPTEVIADDSLVAAEEYDADGQPLLGSYYCMTMSGRGGIKAEFRQQLMGQKVGYEIPNQMKKLDDKGEPVLVDGKPVTGRVIILGIYKKIEKMVEAIKTETQPPEIAAPTPAPAETPAAAAPQA